PVQHASHGLDLWTIARQVVTPRVAPPIPAGLGIDGGGRDLRKEQHQSVGICPRGEAGVPHEGVADPFALLVAAMKDDVHTAPLELPTIDWHVGDAAVAKSVACQVTRKLALVEDDVFASGRGNLGAQGAVDLLQDFAGLIVTAVADIGLPRATTGN